jgi:hypothetical protein
MIPPYSLDFGKGESELDVLEISPQMNTDELSVFICGLFAVYFCSYSGKCG